MTYNSKLKLFVATSTRQDHGFSRDSEFAFAWQLEDSEGLIIAKDSNPFGDGGPGYNTFGLFPAIRAGLSKSEDGSHVEVITVVKYAIDILNTPAETRRERFYLKADRKPLADKELLITIDDEVEKRAINLSGRRPCGTDEEAKIGHLQLWAHEKAKNGGVRPKEWNL